MIPGWLPPALIVSQCLCAVFAGAYRGASATGSCFQAHEAGSIYELVRSGLNQLLARYPVGASNNLSCDSWCPFRKATPWSEFSSTSSFPHWCQPFLLNRANSSKYGPGEQASTKSYISSGFLECSRLRVDKMLTCVRPGESVRILPRTPKRISSVTFLK